MDPIEPVRNSSTLLALFTREKRPENRRPGRMKVRSVVCDRGVVLDVSSTGARVLVKGAWEVGETRTFTMEGAKLRIVCKAVCKWRERKGLFKWVLGLEFQEMDEAQSKGLCDLVRLHVALRESYAA